MIRGRHATHPGPPPNRAARITQHLSQLARHAADLPTRLRYWLADLNSTGQVLLHTRGAWRLRHVGWRRLTHREHLNPHIPATNPDAASDWAADHIRQ